MDELVDRLAQYLHEHSECPLSWDQHSQESQDAWRSLARISINFAVENVKEISRLLQ